MSSSEEKLLPPKPQNSYQAKSAVQFEKMSKENFGTALRKPDKFSESSSRPSANLKTTKHLNVATLDLNAIEPENRLYEGSVTPEARSTLANALKGKSKSQTCVLGPGTSNRGRFLSLDSSDIFQAAARNGNRRNSWYGGNIGDSSSTKRNPSAKLVPVPKPNRRCSRASVETLDSDGLPVQCGIHFDIRADVHRTASGETTISSRTEKSFRFTRKEHSLNVIVNVDSLHSTVEENQQNASQITVDPTQQVYELNGKVCRNWLEVIDRMTTRCPSCSKHIGPVLIAVSLCAGLAIVLSVALAFTWLLNKLGSWWP